MIFRKKKYNKGVVIRDVLERVRVKIMAVKAHEKERTIKVVQCMLKAGKSSEIPRLSEDEAFRKRMFEKYHV